MSPKHILITGNMGYVGPNVIRHLRERFASAKLTGLDVGFFAHCLTGVHALPERLLDMQLYQDIRSVTPQSLEGVDAIEVLDDALARRHAERLGLRLTGTLGLLLDAKTADHIDEVTPLLDGLQRLGFRLSPATRNAVLHLAEEV